MNRPRIRFGLKPLLLVLLCVGAGLALVYQPRFFAAVTIDLGEMGMAPAPPIPLTAAQDTLEDHCFRIHSSKIVADAVQRHERLLDLAKREGKLPVRWAFDQISVFPTEDNLIEIRAVGHHGDRQDLELMVKAVAETYLDFLYADRVDDGGAGIVEFKSGWAPNRR